MLEKIRRPGRSYKDGLFKKVFSYLVLGLICAMFLFIAPMGTQLNTQGVAAQVGPHLIRSRELRNIEENLKRQYQSRLNSDSGSETLLAQIRSQALQHLIDTYTVYLLAKKEDFFVSNKELRETIKNFPAFQEEERFLHSRYQAFLKSQNLSPSHFEERIRRSKLGQDWFYSFKKAIPSNNLEQIKKSERHQYKINFQYAELETKTTEEKKLTDILKAKDEVKLTQFLDAASSSWEETGVFSLISPVGKPIAQNEKILQAIISQLPNKGLAPNIIRDSNKIYIIKILSFEMKEAQKEELQIERLLSRSFGKSNQVFENWLSIKSKNIKIQKRNGTSKDGS